MSKFVAKFRKDNYGDDYSSQGKKKRRKENKVVRKPESVGFGDYQDSYSTNFSAKKKVRNVF